MGHSTVTCVLELYNTMVEAVKKGDLIALLTADQSMAFELINHEKFVNKMAHLGAEISAQNVMHSYLSGRSQYVEVEGFQSDILYLPPVSTIQGSIGSRL